MSDFSKEDRMVMLPAVDEFIGAMLHEGAQNYGARARNVVENIYEIPQI
jgi:hypothetical protein